MKKFNIYTLFVTCLLLAANLYAQNYKAPAIDASGKVTDQHGKFIGSVSTTGMIKDSTGVEIAHVDDEGNLVDKTSGKKLGKVEKNGTFVYHFSESSGSQKMTLGAPMNGVCEVKDNKGKVVLMVHENYKQFGACAYHCLEMKKDHKAMKMK